MPPKKQEKQGGGKKPSATKMVEDRTFGMKNKKGHQTQRQIAQMTQSAKAGGTPEEKRRIQEKAQAEKDKAATLAAQKDEMELFKPLQVQKVAFGVDPKTVLCQFFKKGHCEKGKKCKFAHDLAVERKAVKKDLYQDTREEEELKKKKDETSADWDEEKLQSVVLSKKGNQKCTTDKVCKFFIDAIEDGKYGWFWTCPNGDKCMYQHKLPPGFILKTKEQRAAEKALMDKSPLKTLTLEDFLESERHKLTGNLTPVTPETFAKWKAERMDKKAAEQQAREQKEATGRAMFEKGDWKLDIEDEEADEEDEDEWNLEKLRLETEATREKKELERLEKAGVTTTTLSPLANVFTNDTGDGPDKAGASTTDDGPNEAGSSTTGDGPNEAGPSAS